MSKVRVLPLILGLLLALQPALIDNGWAQINPPPPPGPPAKHPHSAFTYPAQNSFHELTSNVSTTGVCRDKNDNPVSTGLVVRVLKFNPDSGLYSVENSSQGLSNSGGNFAIGVSPPPGGFEFGTKILDLVHQQTTLDELDIIHFPNW